MADVKTNSLRAWVIASRVYSITGAAVPVMIGMALAWHDMQQEGRIEDYNWWVVVLSMLFAFIMQVDANLINDYFDCMRGNDSHETRLGPRRACSEGWVTLTAMRKAIALTTVTGAFVGLPLAFLGGWMMIPIGFACILGAFLYTTHLSYLGLGDVLCLLFFGIVPTCVPYYIQTGEVTMLSLCAGLSAGVVIDAMMIANNYRDMPNDEKAGKRTLCVRLGQRGSQWLFAAVGPVALLLLLPMLDRFAVMPCGDAEPLIWSVILPAVTFLPLHLVATRRMVRLGTGRELNTVLGLAARNILIFGISVTIGILIG